MAGGILYSATNVELHIISLKKGNERTCSYEQVRSHILICIPSNRRLY